MHYLTQEAHCLEIIPILSDINMPGMSGLELPRNIRLQHHKPPPTVIITACDDAVS